MGEALKASQWELELSGMIFQWAAGLELSLTTCKNHEIKGSAGGESNHD